MGRKSQPAAATPALAELVRSGVAHTVHPYEHDPAAPSYGLEAATALGLPPAQVFKTLLAQADADLVVGIVPVTDQLDLKLLAAALGAKKATMADPAVAERTTGYVVGGISPLGQKRLLRTVLDDSAFGHPTVYVSGGRRGLDIGIAPDDLATLVRAVRAPIARPPR